MTTGGLIATAIMLLIVIGTVAAPFLRRQINQAAVDAEQWDIYNLQYQRTLTNIRDLDEDFALGKIQPDFHEIERSKLIEQGVTLLKSMEDLQPSMPADPIAGSSDTDFDDAIEAAIASKRTQQTT